MAKKTSTIRVFELARELSVTSKDLIAKCEAEGIPKITNHMSTISLGLAATVREWFGGADSSTITAVETAAPVDLVKARAKAKKKAPHKKAAAPAVEMPQVETPAVETPAVDTRAVAPPDAVPPPAVVAPSPDETPPPLQEQPLAAPEPLAPAASATDTDPAAQPAPGQTRGQPNVPSRPEVVKPAGPMLQVPSATRLAGPKIIRVETPEPVTHRRPIDRRPDDIRRSGPRAGRGVGVGHPDLPEAPDNRPARPGGRTTRRNKRRTATARDDAGRTGKVGTGSGTGTDQPFNWRTQDLREREARLNRAGGFFKAHRRDLRRSSGGGERAITAAQAGGSVTIAEPITIKDLSSATGVKAIDIVKKLFLAGKPVTVNAVIDGDTATEVMIEYNIELEIIKQKSSEQAIVEQFRERTIVDLQPRSPVITILGHVDHGKTSLLDRIRNSNVAASEAGGITQATSAFRVPVHAGDKDHVITFIDTPGHEAFTEMRARGAKVTDIAVLVVAADDGVMPQTIESINHAKAAEVPIVVALNKIDKPEATDTNIQRIFGQLAEHGLNPAEWGGSTEVVRTCATKGDGIQDLLDALDYQAELLDLKADFGGEAKGTVLESQLAEGRGPVANVLVQEGCLKRGDIVVVGRGYGRVRDIMDEHGKPSDQALPSSPVTISGINEVPDAGDNFYVVKNIREAEAAAAERRNREREKELAKGRISLDNIFERMKGTQSKQLPLVVKADVRGAVDVVTAALTNLSTDDVTISIKHAAVGGINESDVMLAEATGAIVVGFNVTSSVQARRVADARGTEIRLYDVIYDVIDDVRKAAEGLLDPELKLEVLGHAEVREVFKISKVGMVAGCYVTDGVILRNAQIRVTRADIVVEKDRRLNQLRRFKEDAKEARSGQECGMKIDGYDDIKVGDVLECYKTLVVARKL